MPIVHHNFEVEGAVLKKVRCEQCPTEYVYRAVRTARATVSVHQLPFEKNTTAMEEARQKAESDLPGILERAVDPVPCPACGWYQSDMLPLLRGDLYGWMILVAVLLAFLGCLLVPATVIVSLYPKDWLPVWVAATGMTACFVGAVALPIVRSIRAASYDPNSTEVDARIKLGQALTIQHARVASCQPSATPRPHVRRRLTAEAKGWIAYFLFLGVLTGVAFLLAGELWGAVCLLGFFVWALNIGLFWAWYQVRKDQLPSDQSPLSMPESEPAELATAEGIEPPAAAGPASWRVSLPLLFLGLLVTHAGLLLYLGNKSGVLPTFPFAGGLTLLVGLVLFGAGFRK